MHTTDKCIYTHTHTRAHTHTHTHTHACACTCFISFVWSGTQSLSFHVHTCSYALRHVNTREHTYIPAHAHTHTHPHTHTHTHACAHPQNNTRTGTFPMLAAWRACASTTSPSYVPLAVPRTALSCLSTSCAATQPRHNGHSHRYTTTHHCNLHFARACKHTHFIRKH